MAAPSNTVWGDIVKGYDRVGISISQSYTDTQCTVTAQVWFWTKWSLNSKYAKTYFEFDTTVVSDTAAGTTTPINTTDGSGENGWNTANQILLGTYTKVYDRTANEFTQNCAVKINGLSNTSSNVTATTSYTVDSLPKLTLTLNTTEGVKSFIGAGQYSYGDTVQTKVTTEDGYHLVKIVCTSWDGTKDDTWTDMAGLKEFNLSFYMIVDRTATAYAERDTYTNTINHYKQVGINADGTPKWEKVETTTFTGMYGESVTIPSSHVKTYTGFHIRDAAGSYWGTETWSDKAIGSTFTQPAGAVSIEYYYLRDTYDVLYNANGGSGAPEKQTKIYDTNLTLSSIIPTKSGYTFMGWGTSETDTSADYSAGGSYTSNSPITLYAIWKKTLTLSYDANGGNNAPSNQSADIYNATTSKVFTISNEIPTRTGYEFLGWSTSSTATSATYSAGGNITLSQNTKLYAVWGMLGTLGTLRIKQNRVWKIGIVWIKNNSEWKRGVAHKKVKGTWKLGL